ncbi:MAG: hypothetical protein LBB23_04500 [Rickettsiales bacterium]|nr:hypothetical protein [Rickettsiales bacterium]
MCYDKTLENTDLFKGAEDLWFWFVNSKRIRTGFPLKMETDIVRPCQLADVESLITRLYLSGRLTNEEMKTMLRFGMLRRVPNDRFHHEARDAMRWETAMATLGIAAKEKGWVE